jgi:hypothetical protein
MAVVSKTSAGQVYLDTVDLKERFEYTSDEGLDSFRILSNETGPLKGDCDDFATTALWIAEGKSVWRFWRAIFTGRGVIWRVKGTRWVSHAVLYHREFGWIDNQNPMWSFEKKHTLRWPRIPFVIMIKMLIGKFQ